MHVQELDETTCAAGRTSNLGAYVRDGISRRDAAKVEEHLERVPALHGDLPRADRGQLQPGRHRSRRSCSAAPRRRTSARLPAALALKGGLAGPARPGARPGRGPRAAPAPRPAWPPAAVVGGAVLVTADDAAPTAVRRRPAERAGSSPDEARGRRAGARAAGRPSKGRPATAPACPGHGRRRRVAAPDRRAPPTGPGPGATPPEPTARRPTPPTAAPPTPPPTSRPRPSRPPPAADLRVTGVATATAPGVYNVVVVVVRRDRRSRHHAVGRRARARSVELTGDGRCGAAERRVRHAAG